MWAEGLLQLSRRTLAAVLAWGPLTLAAMPGGFDADALDAAPPWSLGGVAQGRILHVREAQRSALSLLQSNLRLQLEQGEGAGPRLVAHAEAEQLQALGDATLPGFVSAPLSADRVAPLTRTRQGSRQHSRLGLDWLYLQGTGQGASAGLRYTLGRQPIAHSLGRLWSPVDTFAPFHPADLERLYKPGVDAAQLSLALPDDLEWSSVASAQRYGASSAQDWHWNWQHRLKADVRWGKLAVQLGQRQALQLLGLGLQVNDLLGSDWYAESLWHRSRDGAEPRQGTRSVIGLSRRLGQDISGTLELFHQTRAGASASLLGAAPLDLPSMGPGRSYLGLAINAQPEPRLGLDLLWLANLSDHSSALTAALAYTPLPDLKLRLSLSLPASGGALSEYRSAGQLLQLGLQWFF